MNGLERETWQTERPSQTTYVIATEGCRVAVSTIHTTIIFYLLIFVYFLEIVIEAFLEIGVCLEVFFLTEIAVFCPIYGDDAVVIYMAARLYLHRRLSHFGVGTKAGTENRELRVGNILGADIPAETRQGGIVEHTESFAVLVGDIIKRGVVDNHDCLAGTRYRCALSGTIFCCCCVAVGIFTHDAGTITSTIDIIVLLEISRENLILGEAEEFLGILICQNSVDGSLCLSFWEVIDVFCLQNIICYLLEFCNRVTYLLTISLCCQPGGDIAVDISILVPYPGTAIHLNLGITEDVGIGSLIVCILFSEYFLGILIFFRNCYISVTTTEDVTTQHTAFDMNQGVAIYRTIGTTAIDVVPDGWHGIALIIECDGIDRGCVGVSYVNDGVTVDATHLFIMFSRFSAKTLAATEYGTEDVAADDIH